MLPEGTGGDGAPRDGALIEGSRGHPSPHSRDLRVQLDATRARLPHRRTAGLDGLGQPEVASDVVSQAREQLLAARERIGHLETALASNRRIGIAIGIVMARNRVTDEAAFALLREQSQARNRKLRDLAEEVIHTGIL